METDDVVSIRRQRLRQIITDRFGGRQSRFVEETGINAGELSGLLRERFFGEKKARKIEEWLGLPPMWLDGMPTQAPIDANIEHADLLKLWKLLTDQQRAEFLSMLRKQAETNRAILEQLAPPDVEHRHISMSKARPKNAPPFVVVSRRKKDVA